MNNQDDYFIATRILEDTLAIPGAALLFDSFLADCSVSKTALFHTAFAQGVIATLHALKDGSLIDLGSN